MRRLNREIDVEGGNLGKVVRGWRTGRSSSTGKSHTVSP
jgi:hypothetical protein